MSARLPAALLCLAFALAFGGVGVTFGLWGMLSATLAWHEARGWQPVEARIVDLRLETRHGDSTTYRVHATYRYRFDGREHVGQRVGIDDGRADNVGRWQESTHARLAQAASTGSPVTVYVDPRAPHRAVIDRSLRTELLLFRLPFAIGFTAVGLGALWMFLKLLRGTPQAPGQPVRPAGPIRSTARSNQIGLWVFTAFWNSIAIPAAILGWPQARADGGLAWLILLFPAIGAWLAWMAASATWRLRRFGEITLATEPQEPSVGAAFTCALHFEQPAGARCSVSLACEEVDRTGEDSRTATLWAQDKRASIVGGVARVSFLPPADLPPSEPVASIYRRWRVRLDAAEGALVRHFDLTLAPFDASRAGFEPPRPDTTIAEPPQLPGTIGTLVTGAEGFALELVPTRHRAASLALAASGVVFAGVGLLVGASGAGVIAALLIAIGAALAFGAMHLATHRRLITVAAGEARVESRSLLRRTRRSFLAMQVTAVTPVVGYSSRSNDELREKLAIKVKLRDGTTVKIADGLPDRSLARHVATLFATALGVPLERVAPAERAGSR